MTDAEGCGQVFSFTVDFMSAVPQPQGTGWDAVVYPNPAMDGAAAYLSIRSPAAQAIELQIFDVAGKAIGRERFGVPGGSWAKPLALPEVAGVYLLVLSNERDTVCLKWVVF